jgi:hypothetical protein
MRRLRLLFCLLVLGLGMAACEVLDSDESYQRPSNSDGLDPAYGGGNGTGKVKSTF